MIERLNEFHWIKCPCCEAFFPINEKHPAYIRMKAEADLERQKVAHPEVSEDIDLGCEHLAPRNEPDQEC